MSSVGDSVETLAVERGSLVMERCKAETKRSTKSTSPPASNPALATTPQLMKISSGANTSPASSLQNPTLFPCDRTGQVAPVGMKPHVTTILWEGEGCLCFQVLAKDVWVSRRQDNNMINGTKLLNVAGMTRGRRDGILKSEKNKHVVTIAPMHLKGVWIPFERALELANKEKITESLYPLFLHSIGSLLDHPSHTKPNHPDNSQGKSQESDVWTPGNHDYIERINVLEHSDKNFQRPLDTVPNNEFNEQGPIGSLFRALTETLGLILVEVRMHSDTAQHYKYLESSCAALFFWDADLGLSRGDIDDILQNSPQLRDTCLAVLISISQFVSTSLIHLISSEDRQKKVLQLTGILTSLEQVMNMVEEQNHSTWRPEQDAGTLCQGLRTKIDTFIMLAPSLASPAEESVDDEEPRMIEDVEVYLPEQAYANSISHKFPLAAPAIVAHLGRLNWDRYNHMLRLQRETMQQELITSTMKKAGTIFHDSGVGTSLPAPCPETVYAPSMVSARAEASHKRVPPLPPQARSGEPFTCEICNKKVQFQRTKVWKKHVFEDILAYACFFAECSDTGVFENGEALMLHLEGHHGMDVQVSDVACPLCIEFTSRDRDVLSLHITRHLEEIALGILPSGVDLDEEPADEESADDSISSVASSEVIELDQGNPNFQATRKSRRLSNKKFHDMVAEAIAKRERDIKEGERAAARPAEVAAALPTEVAVDLKFLEQDRLHRRAAVKKAAADQGYDLDLHEHDFKIGIFASSKKKREGAATGGLGQAAGSGYKTPIEARRVREGAMKAYINTKKVEKHPNASTSSSVPSNMPSPKFKMGNLVHKAVIVGGMRTKGVFTISDSRPSILGHWEYRLKGYYNEQEESGWTRERDLKSER